MLVSKDPAEDSVSQQGGHTIHENHQSCADNKCNGITKLCPGGCPLQAMADMEEQRAR